MSVAEESTYFESIKTIVVHPHEATDDTQLELQVNDIVYVLEQDETGWWGGHKEDEKNTGWFPGTCVRAVQPDSGMSIDAGQATSSQGATGIASQGADQQAQTPCFSSPKPSPECELSSVLEASQISPGWANRSRPVASPQRASIREEMPRASRIAIPGTPEMELAQGSQVNQDSSASALSSEKERLQKENAELEANRKENETALRLSMQKSEADRRKAAEVEALLEQERATREFMEQQVEAAMQTSTEMERLRRELEKERRNSHMHREETEQLRALMKTKAAELHSRQEQAYKEVESERKRAIQLEEQLRSCQEEVMTIRREARQSQQSAAADVEGLMPLGGEARRRLFGSTAAVDVDAATPASGRTSGRTWQLFEGCAPLASPIARPSAEFSFQEIAPTFPLQSSPPPAVAAQPPRPPCLYGSSSACALERPRAMSSGPSPVREGRGRPSSPDLQEAPQPGCVAAIKHAYEKRCQSLTPRMQGEAPRRQGAAERHTVQELPRRAGLGAAAVGTSVKAVSTMPSLQNWADGVLRQEEEEEERLQLSITMSVPPAAGLAGFSSYNDEPSQVVQVELGMSPIRRSPSASATGSPGPRRSPPSGTSFQRRALGEAPMASPASRRQSSIPEVPVAVRIRHYETR